MRKDNSSGKVLLTMIDTIQLFFWGDMKLERQCLLKRDTSLRPQITVLKWEKKKGGEKNGIKPQKGSKPMDPIRTISK